MTLLYEKQLELKIDQLKMAFLTLAQSYHVLCNVNQPTRHMIGQWQNCPEITCEAMKNHLKVIGIQI